MPQRIEDELFPGIILEDEIVEQRIMRRVYAQRRSERLPWGKAIEVIEWQQRRAAAEDRCEENDCKQEEKGERGEIHNPALGARVRPFH